MNQVMDDKQPAKDRFDDLRSILARANEGDLSVLPELRTLLATREDLWREVGDVAAQAEQTFLRLFAGTNLHFMEAIRNKLTELKIDLAGLSPSPVEKLLVDRIAISWLQVHHADIDAAAARKKDPIGTLALHAQRRLDSAHRRYLQAVKTLVTCQWALQNQPLMGASKPARVRGHGFLPHHNVTPDEQAAQLCSFREQRSRLAGVQGSAMSPLVAARMQRHLR